MKRLFAVVVGFALLFSGVAYANTNLSASVKLPVSNDDGSSLTDLAKIRMYISTTENGFVTGTSSSNFVTEVAANSSAPKATDAPQSISMSFTNSYNDVFYFRATAVDSSGNESALSAVASIRLDNVAPGAPVIIEISYIDGKWKFSARPLYAVKEEELA